MFDPDHIHELEGFLYIFSCWPVKLNSLFTLFCVVAYHLYSGNGTDDDGLVSGVVDNDGFISGLC